MELVNHPLVPGPAKRAGLFWFTIAPLFIDPVRAPGPPIPPELVLDPIWALPDRALRAPGDSEDSSAIAQKLIANESGQVIAAAP